MTINNQNLQSIPLLSLVLSLAFLPAIAVAQSRTWTGRTGKQLTAKLVQDEGDYVRLRNVRGKEYRIKTTNLSANDLKYLKSARQPTRERQPSQHSTADQVLQAFPNMSAQAKRAFRRKAAGMLEAQTTALLWQLMSKGESLFSDTDKNRMIEFYWKAVETLTPEEQMIIQKVNVKMGAGQGYSADDQQKSSALVQKGFGNLSDKDNNRYLELRGKAIELALLKPKEAEQRFKSTYPPSPSRVQSMTPGQKQQRIQELTAKAFSLLPEKDRTRFMELQLTPADELTQTQYSERLKYSEKIVSLLSEEEMKEMMELTADILKDH